MPAETPPSPDRLDLAIAESHRLMDETKQLIDQPRADTPGGEFVGIEEERHQESGLDPPPRTAP